MKVLHLVLFNPTDVYKKMCDITRPWYDVFREKGVDTYYYYYDSSIEHCVVDEKNSMFRIPGHESYYPGILEKTLFAFEFFSKSGYDFVVRSNISSPINFALLLQMLEPKKNQSLYGGTLLLNPYLVETQKTNEHVLKIGEMRFVHGTCIVLSPDMLRMLFQNSLELVKDVEDDLSIGLFFATRKIYPQQLGGQFAFFNKNHTLDVAVSFRNHAVGTDREEDLAAMRNQVATLFQRYVLLAKPQPIHKVSYGGEDVTLKLYQQCRENKWTTNQGNFDLDKLFGDPLPNVMKRLNIELKTGDVFDQRCTLTFQIMDNTLYVS